MRALLVLLAVAACGEIDRPAPAVDATPPPPPIDAGPPPPPVACWRPNLLPAALQLGARPLKIGVVADARSADPALFAEALEEMGKVDMVVSLGGHATTQAELEAGLGALAAPGRPLISLPGDREDAAAHAAAIETLVGRGLPVYDGARMAPLPIDGATLVFVPGLPVGDDGRFHGLLAGSRGCGRRAAELAGLVLPEKGPIVVFAHEPPRQSGPAGTDLALGGVHAGEPDLAPLVARAQVFVHAGLDEAAGRIAGKEHQIAASGSISPTPGERLDGDRPRSSAVVVEIIGEKARVRSLSWPSAR